MFDNINDALEYIESKRVRRSLDDFKETLKRCNIDTRQKNMIHIAGTNGKGSTVNYLRSVLNAHGYTVGTFTSPYLITHNDRIRIDDKPISDEQLLYYINKYYDVIEEDGLSMFEIDVLIMLDYFNIEDLDFRIIETGIGGSRDKTNVIEPIISAITNIGMDHTKLLGESLFEICDEKMGIIKEGQTFITSETNGVLLAKLQQHCDEVEAKMVVVPEYQVYTYPFQFSYRDMDFVLENQGIYQVSNARLALTIASKLIKLHGASTINAVEEANWKGRFEVLSYKDVKVSIDGAHNVPGIQSLIQTLSVKKAENVSIVFSCLGDKDMDYMLDMLIDRGYTVYLTSFHDDRAIDVKKVKPRAGMIITESYQEAIRAAYLKKTQIVVTGSLHFISSVRRYLIDLKKQEG